MVRRVLRRGWRPVMAALIALSLKCPFTAAQEQPTFRTQSNVVLVPALVHDKSGGIVYGLKAGDFIVEDEAYHRPCNWTRPRNRNPCRWWSPSRSGGVPTSSCRACMD